MKKEIKEKGNTKRRLKRSIILVICSVAVFCVIGMVIWFVNYVLRDEDPCEKGVCEYGITMDMIDLLDVGEK